MIKLFSTFTIPTVIFIVIVEILSHIYAKEWKSYFPGYWYEISSGIIMMVGIILFSLILFSRIKKLTNSLEIEQERLQSIMDNSPDPIIVLSNDYLISHINTSGEKLLKWTEEQIRGKLTCKGILLCHDKEGTLLCNNNCPIDLSTQLVNGEVEVLITNKRGISIPVKLGINILPDQDKLAGSIIINLRDLSREQAYHQEMERIAELALDATSLDNEDANLQNVLDQIQQLFEADMAVLHLKEEINPREWLSCKAEFEPTKLMQFSQYGVDIVEKVMTSGRGKLWKMEGLDQRINQQGLMAQIWYMAAVPLVLKQQIIGVLLVGKEDIQSYGSHHLEFLRRLANQVAIAVENYHLIMERQQRISEHTQERAVLGERFRLAREIHDGLSQGLGYLKLRTRYIKKSIIENNHQVAINELDEFHGIIEELYQDTRDSITNLKASLNEGENILLFLARYLRGYERRSNITTELIVQEGNDLKLPTWIELHLVRIIQEALNNVRKHAQATVAKVKFNEEDDHWQLTISDNGRGFSKEEGLNRESSFGLTSMKERADEIGAVLDFYSTSEEGTRVIVHLPKYVIWEKKLVV